MREGKEEEREGDVEGGGGGEGRGCMIVSITILRFTLAVNTFVLKHANARTQTYTHLQTHTHTHTNTHTYTNIHTYIYTGHSIIIAPGCYKSYEPIGRGICNSLYVNNTHINAQTIRFIPCLSC